MRSIRSIALVVCACLFVHAVSATAAPGSGCKGALAVRVVADHTNNLYAVGEEIAFTVTASEACGALATTGTVEVLVDNFGPKSLVGRHKIDLAAGNPFAVRAKLDEPGFARLTVKIPGTNDVLWGVGVEPQRIRQGGSRPADFEQFWQEAVAKYDREVVEDVTLEKVEDMSRKRCDVYLVSLTTPHGRKAYGRLSVPKDASAEKRYPLRCTVPGAGPSVLSPGGRNDEIQFLMNVHYYRPIAGADRTAANGEQQKAEDEEWTTRHPVVSWKRYCVAGIAASREDYFYYDAILAIRRAFHWAARRPDVNVADITYNGGSQGGAFGIYMSALCPFFTRSCIVVPAITDVFGYKAGRKSGWPTLVEQQTEENRAAAERNAPYFDAVNFAPMIRNPVRFAVGFIDTTCAPTAVYSAYNALGSADRFIYHGFGVGHSMSRPISNRLADWERGRESKQ